MNTGDYITPTIRLVRLLGRGAMGSVWVATHSGLSTQVAVKLISQSLVDDKAFVERFRCEAVAAAMIRGSNVAQVFDHGVTRDGVPFIVMELLEGEDLRARMRREGPLNPDIIVPIIRQTAKVLGRAHELGIVHRDIKPANLFLTVSDSELVVKVIDFGVAKVGLDDMRATATGAILGTPRYMSPEQFLSTRTVDFRADLWSLGAVVYHALTGESPFAGDSMGEIALTVHTAPIPKARAIRPDLPEALDAWFEKAFSRDPMGRFASARQMADELALAVRGWSPSRRTGAGAQASAKVQRETSLRSSSGSLGGAARTPSSTARGTAGVRAHGQTLTSLALTAIASLTTFGALVLFSPPW